MEYFDKTKTVENLIEEYQSGNESIFEQILKYNEGLIKKCMQKYLNFGLTEEDLYQEGSIGLLEAARNYDKSYNTKFSTFAYYYVTYYISNATKKIGRLIKIPNYFFQKLSNYNKVYEKFLKENNSEPTREQIAKELNVDVNLLNMFLYNGLDILSLEQPSICVDMDKQLIDSVCLKNDVFEDSLETKEMQDMVNRVIKECNFSERELYVITNRYGFYEEDIKSLEEVSNKLNLSRERVRQIEVECLKKMKHYILMSNEGFEYTDNPTVWKKISEVRRKNIEAKLKNGVSKNFYDIFFEYDYDVIDEAVLNLNETNIIFLEEFYANGLDKRRIKKLSKKDSNFFYNRIVPAMRKELDKIEHQKYSLKR